MDDLYTLADGRDVPANSPLARIEREVLAEHMGRLQQIRTTDARRMYLSQVERSEGRAMRDKLADMYAADWEARKAAAEKAKQRASRAMP